MKTILAATDFSDAGNNAVNYAGGLAKSIKAKLIILHVGQIEGNTPEIPQMILSWEAVESAARERLHRLKEHLKKELGEINIECRYRIGSSSDEILFKAKKEHAELIVVGMEGTGRFLDRLMGSVATDLGRRATIPVLIIPNNSTFQDFNKIVLGTDLGATTETSTLQALKTFARSFDSKIFVLNVRKSLDETPSELDVNGSIEVDHFLKGVNHVQDFIESNEVEEGLIQYADENNAQLICIIPHAHSFWYRLTHETHTKKVSFKTKVPLLILH
jgi:nucleotide-binding universal stress UspA family protein